MIDNRVDGQTALTGHFFDAQPLSIKGQGHNLGGRGMRVWLSSRFFGGFVGGHLQPHRQIVGLTICDYFTCHNLVIGFQLAPTDTGNT